MAGLGAAEFDRTVTQKLPLVANDAAIFALASELGWCSSWLGKPRPSSNNDGNGDVSVALMNAAAMAPPPTAPNRRVGTPVPVVATATPVPMAAAPSASPIAPVAPVPLPA